MVQSIVDKKIFNIINDISSKSNDNSESEFLSNNIKINSETKITEKLYNNNITISDKNNNEEFLVKTVINKNSGKSEINIFKKENIKGEDRFCMLLGKDRDLYLNKVSELYNQNFLKQEQKQNIVEEKNVTSLKKLGNNLNIILSTNKNRLISIFEAFKGKERESFESENYILDVWDIKKSSEHPNGKKIVQIYDKNKWEKITATSTDNNNYDVKFSKSNKFYQITDSKLNNFLLTAMLEIKQHLKENRMENSLENIAAYNIN